MFQRHNLLGIIPARAGSKGLPGKNMKPCAGKPLVEWTMEAAAGSEHLDGAVVTTDWTGIGVLARRNGLQVRERPAELAGDFAQMLWVVKDAWLDGYDYAVLLQPTSPTRTADDIDNAIERYFAHRKTDQDTLASVCEVPKAGWLMATQPTAKDGYASFCFPPQPNRQRLTPYYRPNGAIFVLSQPFEFYRRCIPFVMPETPDIDDASDLARAETILLARQNEELLPAQ